MFMFRSRRATLTKRLTKAARKRRPPGGGADDCAASANLDNLLRQLQDNQMEMLLRAVERGGGDCVLVRKERSPSPPHLLCCQTWRWPEVRQASELRRLPSCRSASDPVYVCCNPYHWSRLCQPDSPPPPYSRCPVERLKPEDRAPSEAALVCRNSYPGSLTTNGESVSATPVACDYKCPDGEPRAVLVSRLFHAHIKPTGSALGPKVWCQLAYWELAQRVGPLFPVELPSVNVFGEDVYGSGLCLETLAQHSFSPPESVCRTRSKIGLGVTLSLEDDCVWVYNRSDNPIFINSLTLEDAESPSPTRVPAEHCLCVYDPVKAAHQNYGWDFTNRYGPVDPNSIRISFVKGWGPRYSRQEITSCPCWIEILLAPCR